MDNTRREDSVEAPARHVASGRRARTTGQRPSLGMRIVGVAGELLITAGVLVLAFIGWQLLAQDAQIAASQGDVADRATSEWAANQPSSGQPQPTDTPPVLSPAPATGELFGVLHVPRLGDGWSRPLIGGTTISVLNRLGAGWYPETSLPGAVGNTAFASHRGGHGSNFRFLDTMRYEDKVVLETELGWYIYDYRNTEYVMDTAVDVVNPVPQTDQEPQERLLTLTTCNPYPFTNGERMIVYNTFDTFYPRSGGLPDDLRQLLGESTGGD